MFEEELQRKLQDFREFGMPAYVPRDGDIHLVDRMVSTVVGARRAGKSFRVLQAADELLKRKFIGSLRQICAVDFDNPVLATMLPTDLGLIQQTFLELTPESGIKTPAIFILDEIHRVAGWQDYVIDLSRNPHWKVIVTGSSSRLQREDISTSLRGKAIASAVYPLSFSEFSRFHDSKSLRQSTAGRAQTRALFDEYLKWGAYPAIPQVPAQSRESVLREYFDTMILKDIVQRWNPSKPRQCVQLYNYVLSLMGRPFTLKSAFNFIKQSGEMTSRDAVRDYIAWAEDAWLIFTVPIHAHSRKHEERNYHKIYCIDWALAVHNSSVWDGSFAQALENVVFLHLRRSYSHVRYYLTHKERQEVDFLVSGDQGKPEQAIQVCWDISQPDTLRRELEPLVATASYFGTKENFIVTLNQERRWENNGVVVHALPVWRWLMR